jgi:SAM-dependent methyltransferase
VTDEDEHDVRRATLRSRQAEQHRRREPDGRSPEPRGGATDDTASQDQSKYETTNPVVQRLIGRWLGTLAGLVDERVPAGEVLLDAGAGAGYSLAGFAGGRTVLAADLLPEKVHQAPGRVPSARPVVADVTRLPVADAAVGWATSIEVLEHLDAPEALVAELARVCRHGAIVSVPWEPWFKLGNLARGKNLPRWGNDPEHVQAFGPASLRRLLRASFGHVTVRRCFPWLLAVATDPRR